MDSTTHFAPAERLTAERIRAQRALFGRHGSTTVLRAGERDLTIVVNANRQIVYVSEPFRRLSNVPETEAFGLRPGELLGCRHAADMPGGCGTSDMCRFCGVVDAIMETQKTNSRYVRECTIEADAAGSAPSRFHHFRVTSTPFRLRDEAFVLLFFTNLYELKRRSALERVFFHDIMNSVSGLQMHLTLLRRTLDEAERISALDRLDSITRGLEEEIRSQKQLVYAENGELTVERTLVLSMDLLEEVMDRFRDNKLARDKQISVDPGSDRFPLITDEALLRRVLVNMTKNALEASGEGDTVDAGCRTVGPAGQFWVRNPTVMPPSVAGQVFRRFFSTKGGDRGLGTYSMKLLAEGYLGGKVWFETSEDEGTTFYVSIPLYESTGPRN